MINEKRLVATFTELVAIDSESKNEGKFQAHLKNRFEKLGVIVKEDNAKALTGFGANNLYCVFKGDDKRDAIYFSAHMDTVTPGVGIKPVIKDGGIYSDGTTILGADDKVGIAIMIELVETIKEYNVPHGTIEFVISVGEESGLIGAKVFDMKQLISSYGFILDGGGPVGAITTASPTHYGLNIDIYGITAHAGLEPEKGVSALDIAVKALSQMKLGRIDSETTANVGVIKGGVANNIVMEHLNISAEARSISGEKALAQVEYMVALFEQAGKDMGGQVKIEVDKKYDGYRYSKDDKFVHIASQAIEKIGRKPTFEATGGGSDVNIFYAEGKPGANLAVGYEKVHTVHEYIPIEELVKATEMVLEIVKIVYQG